MKRKLSLIVLLTIVALTLSSLALAINHGLPVIGKATIKDGASFPIVEINKTGSTSLGVIVAAGDQDLYILNKFAPEAGKHRGGYLLDGEGFVHNCPVHGEEKMGASLIILPIEFVEQGKATIQLF